MSVYERILLSLLTESEKKKTTKITLKRKSDDSENKLSDIPNSLAIRKGFVVVDPSTRLKYTVDKTYLKDKIRYFVISRGDYRAKVKENDFKKYFRRG